ncbi:RNA-binding motif protein, X-linked 2-like isoform X2 [Patiria miniata]|uniref:RRM domain-containing protein n=1 Tax=Patiria miniata TaxID=46514 RepID=A0A913ZGV0_PATMI|nr:RNA-binding motif protein, X-linked 2-like isoform X2 [Patiria miniata]
MNPLTNVKNINKLNDIEAELGVVGSKTSWHEQYKDSAYVFIGGLPFDLTEGDIICVFSQYGEIVNINLVRDKKTGKSKGYCFLAYENQRSTILAVDNFNGIKLLGRVLRVDHVSSYRKPKEDENDDDATKQLRQDGCAPRTPSPPPSENDDVEDDNPVPKKKAKKEHKAKAKLHHKKKKKKQKKDSKHSSKSRRDSSDSESSQSETDNSPQRPVRVKQEVDRGYPDFKPERREHSSNGGYTRHRQDEFPKQQKEKSWPRDEGRMDRRGDSSTDREQDTHRQRDRDRATDRDQDTHRQRDRATDREQDTHRQWDRDRFRSNQHGSEREEHTRADKDTDRWGDRGSQSREDRHPDRWSDRDDEMCYERDRTRDRKGERGTDQWESNKQETKRKTSPQERFGEQSRYGRTDAARNEHGENKMKRDRSDERNEKDMRRERDSYRERGSYPDSKSGHRSVRSDKGSHSREDRHPDRRGDKDDGKYYERDRKGDYYEKRSR